MELIEVFERLGIAVGLGLLVGLQRERVESRLAGIRTFPLITLLGALCALVGREMAWGGWVVAGGLLALGGIIVGANVLRAREESSDPGLTTEVAVLVMYGVGAYVVQGDRAAAIAVGAVVAVLLHLKQPLHTLVRRLGDADIKAIMQFAVISLVILPVLPDAYYGPGPYDVLNPFKIWLLVVLIVAIGLVGYVAQKFVGARSGALVGGLLGGLISSTATTVSYARQCRDGSCPAPLGALAVMLASAVVFGRVLVLMAIAAPALLRTAAAPLGAMFVLTAGLSLIAGLMARRQKTAALEHANPSELRAALVFGGLFALVLLATAVGRDWLGSAGLYAVAALSGLTDMDAITLSTAQMSAATPPLDPSIAWRAILIAALANVLFKAGVVAVLGSRELLARLGWLFGITLAGGVVVLLAWPGAW